MYSIYLLERVHLRSASHENGFECQLANDGNKLITTNPNIYKQQLPRHTQQHGERSEPSTQNTMLSTLTSCRRFITIVAVNAQSLSTEVVDAPCRWTMLLMSSAHQVHIRYCDVYAYLCNDKQCFRLINYMYLVVDRH